MRKTTAMTITTTTSASARLSLLHSKATEGERGRKAPGFFVCRYPGMLSYIPGTHDVAVLLAVFDWYLLLCFGVVRYDFTRFHLVLCGVVCYVWYSMAWCGTVLYGTVLYNMERSGTVW